jgi:hypothetical protein
VALEIKTGAPSLLNCGADHPYRFLVHDRDSIYAQALDTSIANLRLRVLKTPYRSLKANSLCERLIGSLRRECLDWAIPLSRSQRAIPRGAGQREGRPDRYSGPFGNHILRQRAIWNLSATYMALTVDGF